MNRFGKHMQSLRYRFILNFLANLFISFSSNILLACTVMAKKGRHFYNYSASFDPSPYFSIEKGGLTPQLSSEKGPHLKRERGE